MFLKVKKVLQLALPAVGEMFLYMLIWVSDTAFMGNYGGDIAVSAVGFGSEIVYTMVNVFIFMGISAGIAAMVAQSTGAQEKNKAEEYLGQGLLLGSILAIFIALLLGFASEHILQLAHVKGEVLTAANIYMKIVALGAFCNMISSMLNAGLRGRGNTVIPLGVAVVVNIIHIFLSWILVFGVWGLPSLGVQGVALATTSAHCLGLSFLLFYYFRFSSFRLRWCYFWQIKKEYLQKIITIAGPSGLQEAIFNSSRLLSLIFIMHLGNKAFAANEITTTIESVSFMPGWGFAIAAITLVGQSIGAKKYQEARQYAFISAGLGIIVMTFCSFLFLMIPHYLVGIFIQEKATTALAVSCLLLAALEQPFMALAMVLEGGLKGSGDAKTPFLIALCTNWLIRVPLMYCVVYVWQLSVPYVWLVTGVQWIIEGLLVFTFFYRTSKQWHLTRE